MNETLNEIPHSTIVELENLGYSLPKVVKQLGNNFLLVRGTESCGEILWVTDSPNWWIRKEGSRFVGLTYKSMLQNRCAVTSIDGSVKLLDCNPAALRLTSQDFLSSRSLNIYYHQFNLMF